MKPTCVHSCKGLCNALEVAEHREQEAIRHYADFAAHCDYPDVRELLQDLIKEREHSLALLRAKREMLSARFDAIDRITESFRQP
jgi:rubrerythrin